MERQNRLFVPLSKEPFFDFVENGKLVEIRKYGRGFTEKFVYTGRRVELRLGYSGKENLWGKIDEVLVGSLEEIITHFGLSITEPQAENISKAIQENLEILGETENYIGFKIQF